ncbi:MAG: aspartate-semialdehyde dehydrogenase [Clostridia bacterium]|nr:aspartate-semialdehyde dehydrogenase [Clostridia bacterium]
MKAYNIAIIGASGMVGKKMLEVLFEKNINVKKLYLFASKNSAGKTISHDGKRYKIIELTEKNILSKKIDFALNATDASVAKIFVPIFAKNGTIVIDNSSCFRMNSDVPLIVPEVNFEAIKGHKNIIASPNCSTIQAVVALAPLHKKFGIKRIIYSTYQAVSGAGKNGIIDLKNGIKGIKPKFFPHPIFNNVIPHIDKFEEDGYTKEEHKMINETRKILNNYSIKITATTVRVPVLNSHSESINIELKTSFEIQDVKKILANSEGIILVDNVEKNAYPTPLMANDLDEVLIGRIRKDFSVESGINLWVVADNIRKGAASNAVQILKKLIKKEKKNVII